MADITGPVLTDADRDFIAQPELSGLIFFARHYESPAQLKQLCADIRAQRPDLLLCVDQEGGRVQRFRDGFTALPPMMTLENLLHEDEAAAIELATELGWLMAWEVRCQGVHLSFAPVLDIERDVSRVIGDRAFGHSAGTVITLATAFVQGMAQAGMAAVGKHFPGHGAVVADSHKDLPVDERSRGALEYDMQPFQQLMAQGLLAGIMPAHVVYPALDPLHTAGFSRLWLQDILRDGLGFQGVIFSDDLTMAGAASVGSYGQRAQAAMDAGADALVVCNDPDGAQQVVEQVRQQCHEQGWQHLDLSALQGNPDALHTEANQQRADAVRRLLSRF
ncbi:MAG: beta-N-acetylhexosaminidase [Oceanospirillaceae bacterium]|nr:beta-N-acetylhexosaminidase [Oceanospirillaceae bacterium]MBT12564.1 beta-N-acetylhexosaminidase [Oceanospirillaceae bacterium]